MLVTLGDRHHLDDLVVIGELGDHPAEIVDDPTQVVSGCRRFTVMECQRISP